MIILKLSIVPKDNNMYDIYLCHKNKHYDIIIHEHGNMDILAEYCDLRYNSEKLRYFISMFEYYCKLVEVIPFDNNELDLHYTTDTDLRLEEKE